MSSTKKKTSTWPSLYLLVRYLYFTLLCFIKYWATKHLNFSNTLYPVCTSWSSNAFHQCFSKYVSFRVLQYVQTEGQGHFRWLGIYTRIGKTLSVYPAFSLTQIKSITVACSGQSLFCAKVAQSLFPHGFYSH